MAIRLTDDDFRSQRAQKPNNQFSVPECQARGLSAFSDVREAEKQLRRPNHKGKLICRVTLDSAGHILKTGRKSHFTWWPLADFDEPPDGDLMKTIQPTETLVYYDGVEVFAGQDSIGGGMIIDTIDTVDRYLVTGVSPEPAAISGVVDLRTLFLERRRRVVRGRTVIWAIPGLGTTIRVALGN